jgi:hypothetical protein
MSSLAGDVTQRERFPDHPGRGLTQRPEAGEHLVAQAETEQLGGQGRGARRAQHQEVGSIQWLEGRQGTSPSSRPASHSPRAWHTGIPPPKSIVPRGHRVADGGGVGDQRRDADLLTLWRQIRRD